MAKLDVIQARVSLAQSDNDLIANERDIATAQASLNRTLGRIIGAPIAPLDSLDVPPPLPDSATIEQIALANRPELAILQNQQQGAHASTSLVKQFWYPDLTAAVQRDYAQPGSPLFTLGISLPLPTFYWQHARGDIAQAQHFERELDATYRDARAQVTQDVRSAYANASTAMRQVVFLRDQLVPAATRGISRCVDELHARRIVRARGARRAQRFARRATPTRRCTRIGQHRPCRSRSRPRRPSPDAPSEQPMNTL